MPNYIIKNDLEGFKCTVTVNLKQHEAPNIYKSELEAKQAAACQALVYLDSQKSDTVKYPVDGADGNELAMKICLMLKSESSKGYFDNVIPSLYE